METDKRSNPGIIILAILGGVAATILVAFLLWPLVSLVFDRYFEINFSDGPGTFTQSDFILDLTAMVWFFISAFAGGLTSALISKSDGYLNAWVLSGIALLFFLYIIFDDYHIQFADAILFIVLFAVSITGFFTSTGITKRIKRNGRIKDTLPSPPDSPSQ